MIRNPEIQFASADAIAAFQEERLRDEVAYLYENSPYYRRMFDGCGMQPGDIRTADDLRHLPVTTKTDLLGPSASFVPTTELLSNIKGASVKRRLHFPNFCCIPTLLTLNLIKS